MDNGNLPTGLDKKPCVDDAFNAAPLDASISVTASRSSNGADEVAMPECGRANREALARCEESARKSMPHAFVVMPFGEKKDATGATIDFNAVYEELIKPALEAARFRPFRADEEAVSGDILTDMFQELLLADLVVVDMSIDNANVFYELGVRHAFRKRGVVHIQAGRDHMPFDVFNVRTIHYHIENGKPDPKFLTSDIENLRRVTHATWDSNQDAVHSPIFNLLTGLTEPDRRTLQTPLATGFWREYNEWKEFVAIARRQKRTGDILLLAEEISNPLIKEEALGEAGRALRETGKHSLALKSYREGLAVNPANMGFRREEARVLSRLGYVDEAIIKLESLLTNDPGDTQATGYLGRIYVTMWEDCWMRKDLDNDVAVNREAAFDAYQWIIKAIDTYLKGFRLDLNNFEPGIKALSLATILDDLAQEHDDPNERDEDIQRIQSLLPDLRSTVSFAIHSQLQDASDAYWVLAALAEWRLTNSDNPGAVKRAFRKAISYARKNVFFLRISLRRLERFRDLGIFRENAVAAIEVVEKAINLWGGDSFEKKGKAFIFAGHMLDRSKHGNKRFSPECEDEVRRQIDLALENAEANENDHGFLSGAACGGDIIFIEACLEKGMDVHVYMPVAEAEYVRDFVGFGGKGWVERFYTIRNVPKVRFHFQSEQVGCPRGDPEKRDMRWVLNERNIRWTLYSALQFGVDKLRLIALWDGNEVGLPPDLDSLREITDFDGLCVSTMVAEMQRIGGIIDHLDITKFTLFPMRKSLQEGDSEEIRSLEARAEMLRRVSLFKDFHDHDLHQIAAVAQERSFLDNEFLAHEGEEGKELFIIVSGEVAVRARGSDGVEYEITRRQAGDYVGELALVYNEMRSASIVAVGEVVTLTLDRAKFRKILRLRPETSETIMRVLATRLVEAAKKSPHHVEGRGV